MRGDRTVLDLLFGRNVHQTTMSKGETCPGVAFVIGMYCKGGIDPPVDHGHIIGLQGEV